MPRLSGRRGVILAGVLISLGCGDTAESVPTPGTDLYAVTSESVLELTLTSDTYRIQAFRWRPDEAFQILSARRGEVAELCPAGDGFARVLRSVSRVGVIAETAVPDRVDRSWAKLSISDSSSLEPLVVMLGIPASDELPVLVEAAERQFTVDLNAAVLRLAAQGCQSLGASIPP